jgi:hypothetical protein
MLLKPKTIEIQDMGMPSVGPEDVLVECIATGICGSDVSTIFTHYSHNPSIFPLDTPRTSIYPALIPDRCTTIQMVELGQILLKHHYASDTKPLVSFLLSGRM